MTKDDVLALLEQADAPVSGEQMCKTLGLTKQDVEDIMYNNAHDLIEGARKSIYG